MRLAEVALDRIAAAPALPLQPLLLADPRAARLAERLREDPSCELELTELARDAGASARTIQRLFLAQTGLRFSEWRQRLQLMHGASLLGTGALGYRSRAGGGYSSTSAFIAAFRKQFGTTPGGSLRGPAESLRLVHSPPRARRGIETLAELPREITRIEEPAAERHIGNR